MDFADIPIVLWAHEHWPQVVSFSALLFAAIGFMIKSAIDSRHFITADRFSKDLSRCKDDVTKYDDRLFDEIKAVSTKMDDIDENNRREHRQINRDLLMLSSQWSYNKREGIAQRFRDVEKRMDDE